MRIPKLLHEEISSEYAKTDHETGATRRAELEGKSFEERQEEGLKVMRKIGIIE
ncbi:MAG: hypothetical protein WB816_09150 [Methylocystis sp.]